MNTTKQGHTKGPWKVKVHEADRDSSIGVYAGSSPICTMAGHFDADKDAALIASAPELLEALKTLMEDIDNHDTSKPSKGGYTMAKAVIAKAEGR